MNRKGLTRGDGLVVVCVLLVFIFSFLPFYGIPAETSSGRSSYDDDYSGGPDKDVMFNAWTLGFQPLSAALVMVPLISLLALLAARFMDNQEQRPLFGLTMRQWSVATSAVAAWCALWSFGADYFTPMIDAAGGGSTELSLQYGAYVIIPAVLVMALVNAVQDRVAGLAGPLASSPAPGYPGHPQYSGQYPGQMPPGASYAGQPQYVPQTPPPAAQAPVPSPSPSAPPADAPAAPVPAQAGPGEGGAAFAQFWFAVPEPRDVLPVEGLDKTPVGTLRPGTWYLAVAEHGRGLVAEIDGRHGVLNDLTGIQRGDS